MYRSFYGLQGKPFELSPSSDVVYLSDSHQEALATLRYGVISDKGFLLLTGGIGTGKTTILNCLLKMVKEKVRVCVLNNPTLTRHEFYSFLAAKLGLAFDGDKAHFLVHFAQLLQDFHQNRQKILLIIDEAQVFPLELLEEVRLLSNQAGEDNVLSIFLIGQPELQEVLSHPRLLPLRQRIGINYHLRPFGRGDTERYIAYRLNKAGAANPVLFTEAAIERIHQASSGNPRLINIICDHALVSGFVRSSKLIDGEIVEECVNELRLPGEPGLTLSPGSELENSRPVKRRSRARRINSATAMLSVLTLVAAVGVLFYYLGWISW
ncbi:ExeA family protein [Desulfofustis limnaeus]|uniref:AAA+ ATPase domain-containing protein n=1 Tax=Desulfofustis limnaeus TaxID=2740163 RepID=A0ABM7W9P5_9BACT|nr:AAA family ATPase [Desulfofustis limnaeus]BDD87638.1 hypothetical protein DPPLL_20030 [Desulfofustis limnaeus]